MTRNPHRLAWTILWLSFLTFCVLVVTIPLGINAYFSGATRPKEVSVEILRGTVLLQEKGTKYEVNAAGKKTAGDDKAIQVGEGDILRTVENSQAVLWLFDGSNVQLWPNTIVSIEKAQQTRYNDNAANLVVRLKSGHARFEVAPPTTKSRQFEVPTPEASIQLREGSYSIDRSENATDIIVHSGSASVQGQGGGVELVKNERTRINANMRPMELPAAQNLIYNGLFKDGLNGWQVANRGEEEPIEGSASVGTEDGREAVHFLRTGATKHCETYLFQQLNKDITDFRSVKLGIDLKLVNQSLSGGGIVGSEYPLLIRLKYRDVYNSEAYFVRGFYYQNQDNFPTHNGQLEPQHQWQSFEIDLLDVESRIIPRPSYLLWIEVAASGHNYESFATNVRLIAQ